MKPVLIVEGKQQEIYAMYYRDSKVHSITVTEQGGVLKTYHDTAENTQYYKEKPLQINFSECLKWIGQHDVIFDSIGEVIAQNQLEIQLLADEIANDVEEKPFAVNEKVQDRKALKQRTYGLMDAREIVQAFMQEDVDLSGGEEIER
ncbi:ribosomal protein S3 [Solibacillus silvestris StLB046]|uniref:Ribosomal protein S3 n=1 Tax=Solibacillus silvestris (strain StLB046) TaxID=1002809 RepID=F2F2H7_SOLSS|nr:hypothetical protein [Solibacillus silvestris]BAK15815.1 ribosomal protein S3 [Solibacillus silvestris StLB046]